MSGYSNETALEWECDWAFKTQKLNKARLAKSNFFIMVDLFRYIGKYDSSN